MKKVLVFNLSLCIALMGLVGCGKKPAQTTDTTETTETAETTDPAQITQTDASRYIDIVGLTPAGGELSLSSLVGQTDFVLIDFWASWCGPCRRFVPVLKEIYAGQPEGHLQILSCSVDQDVMAWQVALNEEQMPWPQMREDADHMCSDKYGVQFIPHTVLIDKSGKIVAVNPEEPELEELLFGE